MNGATNLYLPRKGDIVSINFDPSRGVEIKKRRPALVISSFQYSKLTGLAVVVPITHASNNRFRKLGLLIPTASTKVDGFINPLQFHTFDVVSRKMKYIDHVPSKNLKQVLLVINDIINAREEI